MKNPIDPRATRRYIECAKFERNSALYSTYNVIVRGTQCVVLERKPEFCVRRSA